GQELTEVQPVRCRWAHAGSKRTAPRDARRAAYRGPVPRVRRALLDAAAELAGRDPVLARIIETAGPPDLRRGRPRRSHFAEFVTVRGIGRWTAEMFLIFQLGRLDVWPVDDFGVRKGYGRLYGIDPAPTARELAPRGDGFRPFRSVAAWYCWRAADDATA